MALSVGSLCGPAWKVEGVGKFGQVSISPVRSGYCRSGCRLGRWKGESVIACSSESGEAAEGNNAGGAKPSPGSWLQLDSRADSYGGWSTDENRSNGDTFAGWLKIGGALFLAIGISLGARSLYSRKGVVNEFSISVPVKEQIVSPADVPDSSAIHQSMDKDELVTEAKQKMQNKEGELEPFVEDVASELQHEGTVTTGQVSLPLEEVENFSEKDGRSTHCTAITSKGATFTVESTSSETIELEEFQESSISKDFSEQRSLGSFSTSDVDEKPLVEDTISSDIADISHEMSAKRHASLSGLSATVFSEVPAIDEGENRYVPSLKKVTLKDEISNELHKQLDFSDSSLVALDENRLSTESNGHSVHELPLSSPSLSDPSEVSQTEASQAHGSSESSKEFAIEMSSVGQFELDGSNCIIETFQRSPSSEHWHLTSVGIPAPTVPTAAAEANVGRVLVPAPVDHMQEQALAALQALKVIEVGVKPDAICTRREYARWLIASSSLLTRSPAHRVFPAMYIENVTELAFDDVSPEDPDFPFIQGLAEAGLISSELTKCDKLDRIGNGQLQGSKKSVFLPDSPLSRQDLISWKLALERHAILAVTKEALLEKSGFIDADRIHQDAWPSLLADLSSGERSIVALAFGYTRRFQPYKPVTKGQAAIALSTGEAAEIVSEELARLEAESIAEAAVAAELALETKAQQEVVATFNQLLEEEKTKTESAEKLLEMTCSELEKLKADREEEKFSLLKEQTALESERELYFRIRHEVEDQAQLLSNSKLEIAFERERAKKLSVEAEAEKETLVNMQSELEAEKKALMLARSWAEEEARKAHTHAKVLEEARKRWESQGVHVQVHKELDETNIPALSWQYGGDFQEQKSPVNELLALTRNVRGRVEVSVGRAFSLVEIAVSQFRQKAIESLLEMGKKGGEVMFNVTSAIAKTTESIQHSFHLSVTNILSGVREGTRRLTDGFKGEAERLAQKLKIT
eukprot:c28791_g1_i2 orf=475-3420(-)